MQLLFDDAHGLRKIFRRTGPARGENSRRAVQGLYHKTGVVRECWKIRGFRRSFRFYLCVGLERGAVLFRLRQTDGSENKLFSLSGSSTIIAPYRDSEGRILGVLGVIGPTRLNYARVIPMVDYTALVVSRILGGK